MTARRTLLAHGERALDLVAGGVMFALMALTCADVVGRYLLKMPVRGGLELTEIMMTVLIFAGLPLVTAQREHVTVDLLDAYVPAWLRAVQARAVDLVGVVCLAVASWQLWVRAGRAAAAGDTTASLKLPLAPAIWFMAVLAAAAAVALAARAFADRRAR